MHAPGFDRQTATYVDMSENGQSRLGPRIRFSHYRSECAIGTPLLQRLLHKLITIYSAPLTPSNEAVSLYKNPVSLGFDLESSKDMSSGRSFISVYKF